MNFKPGLSLIAVAPLVISAAHAAPPLDLDFADGVGDWRVVVDGVMGGLSTGRITRSDDGTLVFDGRLSLENNGGFSQVRSAVPAGAFVNTDGVELRVRGDGRSYTFDIRCSDVRLMAGAFQAPFETTAGVWETIRIPFESFRLYNFGREIRDAPPMVRGRIEAIGVTLGDKRAGPFRLEIASIRAMTAGEPTGNLGRSDEVRPGGRSTEPFGAAIELMTGAIEAGAPLFNEGQPAACAAIYRVAVSSLVTLAPVRLGPELRGAFDRALTEGAAEPDPGLEAWIYRRAMDEAFERLMRRSAGPDVARAE